MIFLQEYVIMFYTVNYILLKRRDAIMKKTAVLILCAAALICLASCSESSTAPSTGNKSSSSSAAVSESTADSKANTDSESTVDSVDLSFVKPSAAVSPDLSKPDPSDDSIKFLFDDKGRVQSCKYTAGQKEYMVTYTYKEDTKMIDIYGFSGSIVVAEEHFDMPDFDDSQGFCEKDGYFFNKYKF